GRSEPPSTGRRPRHLGGSMSTRVLLLLGTKKGGFIVESDAERRKWRVREPVCQAWPINHFNADPARRTLYAAGGHEWHGPGGGGLCLHSIVPHPSDTRQMWVAISSAGTFYTADGGVTWTAQNRGVRADFAPEKYPETGQCVHNLQLAPSLPERLYQQNHCG